MGIGRFILFYSLLPQFLVAFGTPPCSISLGIGDPSMLMIIIFPSFPTHPDGSPQMFSLKICYLRTILTMMGSGPRLYSGVSLRACE